MANIVDSLTPAILELARSFGATDVVMDADPVGRGRDDGWWRREMLECVADTTDIVYDVDRKVWVTAVLTGRGGVAQFGCPPGCTDRVPPCGSRRGRRCAAGRAGRAAAAVPRPVGRSAGWRSAPACGGVDGRRVTVDPPGDLLGERAVVGTHVGLAGARSALAIGPSLRYRPWSQGIEGFAGAERDTVPTSPHPG